MPTMRRVSFESCETLTQSEFAEWVMGLADDNHYELLNGRVVMEPPAGWPHGRVGARISSRLMQAAEKAGRGEVFDASQGFELPSGDTVEPDVSFVSAERFAAAAKPRPGKFLRMVPDLIVEVLSPSNAWRDRGEKKGIYEQAGVREYWLADPRAGRIVRFARGEDGRFDRGTIAERGEELESAILAGLRVAVDDVLP